MIKGMLLTGNCSRVTLLLENGTRLEADAQVHDIQTMLDLWRSRYEIVVAL